MTNDEIPNDEALMTNEWSNATSKRSQLYFIRHLDRPA